jgi:predicted transport protein
MVSFEIQGAEKIPIKSVPGIDEKWIKEFIDKHSATLGLGNLYFKESEKIQPGAGRIDLVYQDADDEELRYEIEVQLGSTNESHIIRTIEYWLNEKQAHPNLKHVAVLIAEDVTHRFYNVIHLFNGQMPLIAIQMGLYKFGDNKILIFNIVLSLQKQQKEETNYIEHWKKRASPETFALTTVNLFDIIKSNDPYCKLKYNKNYIGIEKNGQVNNFVTFQPQKSSVKTHIHLQKSEDFENKIKKAGIKSNDYSKEHKRYGIYLTENIIRDNAQLIKEIFHTAQVEYSKIG